ncbi:diacylglycerol O-acyltransferase 3 isoform X1 [Tripterygium wilfordii]|nr:diacylglycerol O-acyltransferase 3 isoform X1 [Tripterygium wilfordii]
MDVSGLVFRQFPCMGACYRIIGDRDFRVCSRLRIVDSVSGGFRDDGHIQYYKSGWPRSRCEAKKRETDSTKKKLKMLKGLTRDLSTFSGMDRPHTHGLVSQLQGKAISVTEAAEILLKQLQLLKAEEKELKRKRKQEKARLKAQRMETKLESESSSSSESSDSECGEVIDMSGMQNEAAASPGTFTQESTASTLPALLPQELNTAEEIISQDCNGCDRGEESCIGPSRSSNYSSIVDCQVRNVSRIEICMGGKCKKSGGAALLEEFGRVMGVEGAAVGCKCMGKCRDGPNVRILNEDDSVRTPPYPLCIGVGLDDVGVIVANFFGQKKTQVLGLNPSS